MRPVTGDALVRMAASAHVHQLVGADELERDEARQDAWHTFADLMRDVADCAAELGEDDRAVLAAQVDGAIAHLRRLRVRVIAGLGGGILFVAVVPARWRRDLRLMFAAG
jgi:hypothetical protein